MGEFSRYLKYDIQQLTKRNTSRYFYIILIIISIIDVIWTYVNQSRFFNDTSQISSNWYVFLENSESLVRGFYFVFIPILAILPFGLQYYDEKNSKYKEYLISKGSRKSYYLSKFIISFVSGFITIFIFLIVNYIIVHLIYPNNFILGGTFLEPDSGAFLEKIFYSNVHLYEFIYIVINSLIAGILSLLSLSLCMLFNYKNGFLVIAVPFIIYIVQSVVLFFFNPHYDINQIIQPATRYGFTNPITSNNIITILFIWFISSAIFFVIGYKKESDIL